MLSFFETQHVIVPYSPSDPLCTASAKYLFPLDPPVSIYTHHLMRSRSPQSAWSSLISLDVIWLGTCKWSKTQPGVFTVIPIQAPLSQPPKEKDNPPTRTTNSHTCGVRNLWSVPGMSGWPFLKRLAWFSFGLRTNLRTMSSCHTVERW